MEVSAAEAQQLPEPVNDDTLAASPTTQSPTLLADDSEQDEAVVSDPEDSRGESSYPPAVDQLID